MQCGTFLPKQYLWGTTLGTFLPLPGELLAGRYLCQQGQIFLDTKPDRLPESLEELPYQVVCYLRLISHWLHVPQVYAIVPNPQMPDSVIVLLENVPIYPVDIKAENGDGSGVLMPGLKAVWTTASPLQQLHWLWQIAQLWEPLNQEGVAESLLSTENLRVEGSLIRLLSLVGYQSASYGLPDLAAFWQQWQVGAHRTIAPFLESLCEQMLQGQISYTEQLIEGLDQAIAVCSQTQVREVKFATLTDQGPTRQRNEDACYPASGTTQSVTLASTSHAANPAALVVVCDGIGGHEGGNIASNLAIATVQQRLQPALLSTGSISSTALITELKQTAIAANDMIVQRNDTENRQERQRMGTTLVMALGLNHELYLTHVGDSRAYRITRLGCHQVTLDDDLASREVRMGYGLYRDALRQPGSGSLVQALGMAVSMVHPTVQRFILDEECLFLLCSDGLSDNNLIEEHWQTALVPVLEGTLNLSTAVRQLVAIANQQNGHDNVTVGLLHCRVQELSPSSVANLSLSQSLASLPTNQPKATTRFAAPADSPADPNLSTLKTQIQPQPGSPRPSLFPWLLGLLSLLGLAGILLVWLAPNIGIRLFPAIENNTLSPNPPIAPIPESPSLPSPSGTDAASPQLTVQSRVLVNRSALDGAGQTPVLLSSQPASPPGSNQPLSSPVTIPVGTVLEVIALQVQSNQRWLELKVCSLPKSVSAMDRATSSYGQPGETGWIQEAAIAPLVTSNLNLTPAQLGACAVGDRSDPPPPTRN
jgi:serine/threonine protein phosphatase PrpC